MRLLILRHGQAEHRTRPDEERHLDAVGDEEARQAAAFIASYAPDRVWVSPYRRTRETAAWVLEALPGIEPEFTELLTPDAHPLAVLSALPDAGTLLLLSHMPMVACLHGLLTQGSMNLGKRFKTGQVRVLEAEFVGMGQFAQIDKFSR